MDEARHRDGLLAGTTLALLLVLLGRRAELDRLREPLPALAGILTALVVEWAFLRYPERLLARWDRPVVSGGSVLVLSAAAIASRRRPRLLATACWGVLTYAGLLVRLAIRDVRR